MNTRPAFFNPVVLGMYADEAANDGAGPYMEAAVSTATAFVPRDGSCGAAASISRVQWLNSLQEGAVVLVRTHTHEHFPATITYASPCYLHAGKLKFHRLTGTQTKRQQAKVYRMRLRLVRSETERP